MFRVTWDGGESCDLDSSFREVEEFVEDLLCRRAASRVDVWQERGGVIRHLGTLEPVSVDASVPSSRLLQKEPS